MKKKTKAPVVATLPVSVNELVKQENLVIPTNGNKSSNGHNGKTNGHSASANGHNGKAKGKKQKAEPTEFTDELNTRELLKVLTEWRQGDFSYRMPIDKIGLSG